VPEHRGGIAQAEIVELAPVGGGEFGSARIQWNGTPSCQWRARSRA
jgi:hypothetical protein